MQIVQKSIDVLIPYENNPRDNDNAVEAVANSIRQFGFKQPIVIDSDNVVVAGHTRLLASKQLGLDTVPCVVADDLTEEQVQAYRLADNKTAELAEWNFEKLELELMTLDMDMVEFGFDEAITPDGFGTDFELPDGDKSDMCQITFYLHKNQKELIEEAMQYIGDNYSETFGNQNKHGNQLYEVVRQWEEQRK